MSDDSNEGGLPTEFDHPSAGRCKADRSKLAIRWSGGVTVAERDALLERLELELAATGSEEEAATDGRRRPGERVNQTEGLSWVTRADGARISRSTIRDLEASTEVDWISLAFRTGAGGEELASLFGVNPTRVYVSDELRGRLDDLQAGGVPVRIDARRSARLRGSLALAIEQASVADGRTSIEASADIEAALAREGIGNAFVRLENIPFLSPACQAGRCGPSTEDLLPNDPEFPDQWGLRRIQAPRAWHLTDGDPDIVVAVIDEGVELGHPDLSLHPQSWNASSDTPDGGPVGSHGTPCAGIVAGTIDNGIGVSGVAGRCRIMAVATATWSDIDIAEGLYFAVDNGARVVSMSFGVYPSWGYWDFDVIRDALQYALDRGLVLVAASGNENRAQARFPGSDSRTLCVGGTNRADLRKSVGDSSSEPFWGASFGPDLDVVAPCLEIPSTDRLGAAGYADGDYMDDFNGTSSAAPHVAGLAALIVSLRPDLSNETVREIIERTCDKVGPSTYDYALVAGKPNGSWHEEVGYGRINVERALLYACDHGRVWRRLR